MANRITNIVTVVLIMANLETVETNQIKKRLMVLENRIGTLEMRVTMEASQTDTEILEFSDKISILNETVHEMGTYCEKSNMQHNTRQEHKHVDTNTRLTASRAVEKRLLTAFQNKKIWVNGEFERMKNELKTVDNTYNALKKTHLEMESVVQNTSEMYTFLGNISIKLENLKTDIYKNIDVQMLEMKENIQFTNQKVALIEETYGTLVNTLTETSNELNLLKMHMEESETALKASIENINEVKQELKKQKEIQMKSVQNFDKTNQDCIRQLAEQKTTMERKLNELENKYLIMEQDVDQRLRSLPSIQVQPERRKECQTSWSKYGQFCYRSFSDRVDFNRAQTNCAAHGAYVVDIQDMAEAMFVYALVPRQAQYWIGLKYSKTENVWKWEKGNNAASFGNWGRGEPDKRGECAIGGGRYFKDKWAGEMCFSRNVYVCKKDF